MKKTMNIMAGIVLAAAATAMVGCSDQTGGPDLVYTPEAEISNLPLSGNQHDEFADNPFVDTKDAPTSTFSVDADGASYAIIRSYLRKTGSVPPAAVRIEEMLNYFTFDYPSPADGHSVAINAEVAPCPWQEGHWLLRLGLKGREVKSEEMPLANYVFLVDVSGSMQGGDRLDLLKTGLKRLLPLMNPNDRISLITYSGEVRKLLESTPASEATKIARAIDLLEADGYTNGGEALKMAYEEAQANFDPSKNNRIILGTDGDFNFGVTTTEALTEMVESYASKGIYLSCMGFGFGNLNDGMMESITNHGNGTYYYIESEEEMMKVFVNERERFVSVANDTKCQVTFDPALVQSYRLIGYENRVMANEDFADDTKDAGEIGAGQTITALYELVPAEGAEAVGHWQVGRFDCRYKQRLGGESLPLTADITAFSPAEESLRPLSSDMSFAAGVAAYGMLLRRSPYAGEASMELARKLVGDGLDYDPFGYRRQLAELMTTNK